MRPDRDAFRTAVPVGPLLALGSYAVLVLSGAVVDDVALVACLVWPVAGALLVALVRPGARVRWLSAAAGALLGVVLVVGVVLGGISLVAAMLSDPGPGG